MTRKKSWVDIAREPGKRTSGLEDDLRSMADDPDAAVPPEVRARLKHAAAYVLILETWDSILGRWVRSARAAAPDVVGVGQSALQQALHLAQDIVDDEASGIGRVLISRNGAVEYVVTPESRT